MPLVRIDIMEGRPPEKIRELHGRVAALVAEILETPIERVRTYITQFPPEGWGIGGVPADVARADEVAARRAASTERTGTRPTDPPRAKGARALPGLRSEERATREGGAREGGWGGGRGPGGERGCSDCGGDRCDRSGCGPAAHWARPAGAGGGAEQD